MRIAVVFDEDKFDIEVGEACVFLKSPEDQVDASRVAIEIIGKKLTGGQYKFGMGQLADLFEGQKAGVAPDQPSDSVVVR